MLTDKRSSGVLLLTFMFTVKVHSFEVAWSSVVKIPQDGVSQLCCATAICFGNAVFFPMKSQPWSKSFALPYAANGIESGTECRQFYDSSGIFSSAPTSSLPPWSAALNIYPHPALPRLFPQKGEAIYNGEKLSRENYSAAGPTLSRIVYCLYIDPPTLVQCALQKSSFAVRKHHLN